MFRRLLRPAILALAFLLPIEGCQHEGVIEIDLKARPVKFLIDHRGWPRPFWYPRVTEFAIASEEDGPIWQLEAADETGQPARNLEITYGLVPKGFVQIFPEGGLRPRKLVTHRTYFAAAGGPRSLYKMVFSMPLTSWAPISPTPEPNYDASTQPAEEPADESAPAAMP